MRFFYLLFLLAFGCAAGLLAYENQRDVTLNFFNNSFTISIPLLVLLTYLAGMFSGWTIVGMLRRSVSRVLERPLPGERAHAH